jgi:hypothetical protein
MRLIDTNSLNALRGSRAGDRIEAYVWYDGDLVYPDPLPISAGGFDWDIARQVQTFDCTITDESGKLAPWLLEDPLGVGGARLHVRYQIGNAGLVGMGVYRIGGSDPEERWRAYIINEGGRINTGSSIPNGKRLRYVSGGSNIKIKAYDLGLVIKRDRLAAPESPPSGTPTVISEIKRLLADICPVSVAAGVVDRNVSKYLVYERDRMDAVQDLCKRIFCDFRMTGDGQLEVYPVAQTAPIATLEGGPDGMLVEVNRSQNIEGLHNRFIVDGMREVTGPDGQTIQIPIRSLVDITEGALRVSGPHGVDPEFYSSPLIASQADADEYAATMRDTQLAGLTTDLRVTCLPLPHVQIGDWVQVGNPIVNGDTVALVGRVKNMSLRFNGTTPDRMVLVVQCSYSDVETVMKGVDRG